jgi:hypothetical protein
MQTGTKKGSSKMTATASALNGAFVTIEKHKADE